MKKYIISESTENKRLKPKHRRHTLSAKFDNISGPIIDKESDIRKTVFLIQAAYIKSVCYTEPSQTINGMLFSSP